MSGLLHQLLIEQAEKTPDSSALGVKSRWYSYASLAAEMKQVAAGLQALGLADGQRIAIFLPKSLEAVLCCFGASAAGCTFVPVNPVLKPVQVLHVLKDSDAKVLVTSAARWQQLWLAASESGFSGRVIFVGDSSGDTGTDQSVQTLDWTNFLQAESSWIPCCMSDRDRVAIFYTSGSTGRAKGVVLSHRNMVLGAHSVAGYLGNSADDCVLAALPLSFDYGFSQLTTAFSVGAGCYLLEYLFPTDLLNAVCTQKITGLALVPSLWIELATMNWPEEACRSLRYITNSGGAMPTGTLRRLRDKLPGVSPYLMYGLTEAFRSTYLPPEEVDKRPTSIGKAIPAARLLVVNERGEPCQAGEMGQLVHVGELVAQGYWNNEPATRERFRSISGECAVWSGDRVSKDADGFFYFHGREDEMIKSAGYRISPSEVEELASSAPGVSEVVAVGVPHPVRGETVVLLVVSSMPQHEQKVVNYCRQQMPGYMVPSRVLFVEQLQRNANGKVDRKVLASKYRTLFSEQECVF